MAFIFVCTKTLAIIFYIISLHYYVHIAESSMFETGDDVSTNIANSELIGPSQTEQGSYTLDLITIVSSSHKLKSVLFAIQAPALLHY